MTSLGWWKSVTLGAFRVLADVIAYAMMFAVGITWFFMPAAVMFFSTYWILTRIWHVNLYPPLNQDVVYYTWVACIIFLGFLAEWKFLFTIVTHKSDVEAGQRAADNIWYVACRAVAYDILIYWLVFWIASALLKGLGSI